MKKRLRNDFDSPWKQAIYLHLSDFLQLCFPHIHAQVDWGLGYQVLDKELPSLSRSAQLGSGHADTLIRVTQKGGQPAWVMLHIEIQSQADPLFPQRMYVYNYRVFDKHPGHVVSLAVLGDNQPSWRPGRYHRQLWGCRSLLTFPIVKLSQLESTASRQTTNPVAWLIQAHLRAQQTPLNSDMRLHSKIHLVRGLYGCGLTKQQVIDFFHLVDWVLALSPDLEYAFRTELALIEEESIMPYITSVERLARQEGLEQGLHQGLAQGLLIALDRILQRRFLIDSSPLLERLRQRGNPSEIEQVLDLASTLTDYPTLDSHVP